MICSVFSVLFKTEPVRSETGIAQPAQLISGGEVFSRKGDFEQAILAWNKALSLLNPNTESGIYLDTVIHLADAYQSVGYHLKGLTTLRKALPIAEKNNDGRRSALFFSTLADIHLALGNENQAIEYTQKSLDEARSAKDPRTLATVLINAGNTLVVIDDYEGAMAAYSESLDIIEDTLKNGSDLKIKVLTNSVYASFFSQSYDDTIALANYALTEIEKTENTHDKAGSLITLSLVIQRIANSFPEPDKDLTRLTWAALNKARETAEGLNDLRMLSYACGYMGELYESEGRYSEALKLTRRAIFFAQQGDFSDILYLWQWQAGSHFKAQGKKDKAARAYQQAVSTLNPIRHELFSGYRRKQDTFNKKIRPVYLELAGLYLEQAEAIRSQETGKKKQAAYEEKLKAARDTMELLKTAELEDFFEDECVTALRAKSLTLDRTPPGAAIIYPIILSDKLALLLTLPDSINHISVPVDSMAIEDIVSRYRWQLQNRMNNRFLYGAEILYDWIIRPMEKILEQKAITTLIIAPDGALRKIPLSTLYDGNQYLVEKYAMAIIPAISLTDPEPFQNEDAEILLSGLSEGRQGFSPLPSVVPELRDIKEIMDGKVVLKDKEFTVENLTDEFKNREYTILHLATHGVFGGTPQASFLLNYETKLNMDDLEELISISRFRENPVELLTLSACQTALGNERAALGLAGVAVKAGVRSAVATLWYVDDEATSLAVREFYRQLKKPGMSKAKALQNAQKKLISQPRYWHPLYWAPFLLIGNWM